MWWEQKERGNRQGSKTVEKLQCFSLDAIPMVSQL